MSPERAADLVQWLLDLSAYEGDEIGLHIHPYCSFVLQAGLPCRSAPSYVYASGDATGYTVHLNSYTEEEAVRLFDAAKRLVLAHGLPTPTTFRAGGWTAEIHTLRALGRAGFVADSSANNWRRLEEWRGYPGAALYAWNESQWHFVSDTSQPYYPSRDDIASDASPQVPVLEVPDNGSLVDYVTGAEMIRIFRANWPSGALDTPATVVIGYHPPNFDQDYFDHIDTALGYIDRYLNVADGGPVVYEVLRSMPSVWKLDP